MSIHIIDMNENFARVVVMDEARDWFARVSGAHCTAVGRMAFQRWKAMPGHAEAYAATEALWRSFEGLADHPDIERLTREVLARTGPIQSIRRRFAPLAPGLAAALICAVGVGAFVYPGGFATERYSTGRGERSTITLADGSKVFLNSATGLEVRMGGTRRELRLNRGEALFEVARDPNRPFTVAAGDGEVIVLGTRFQVRSETSGVTVTLLEGAVALDRDALAQPVRMAPGEEIRFLQDDARLFRRTVDAEVAGSWVTGWLRFRSTPLAEVVAEVNRYSASPVRLGENVDPDAPVSGTFELGDSGSVVAALEVLLPVTAARRRTGEIILQSR